jgi:hypothetical protein
VAYDGDRDRYLVVWVYDYHGDGSDWDVRGRFIPWDGPDATLTEFSICDLNSEQWGPKVVYNENPAWAEFLVVWANTATNVKTYISDRRVSAGGSGFPGGGFTIASDTVVNRASTRTWPTAWLVTSTWSPTAPIK